MPHGAGSEPAGPEEALGDDAPVNEAGGGRARRDSPAANGSGSVADLTVRELLESLAARTAAPAGGSAAGLTVGLAAALCAMAARFSERSLETAGEIAEAADRLRRRAVELADEDARAYSDVLAARRLPADTPVAEREAALAAALSSATAVPLELAEIGGEIGLLATKVASEGNPNLLGDALIAMLLAEAAASAASTIAEINREEETPEVRPEGAAAGA